MGTLVPHFWPVFPQRVRFAGAESSARSIRCPSRTSLATWLQRFHHESWWNTQLILQMKGTESYWKLLVSLSPVLVKLCADLLISKVSWWVPVRTNGCCEDMCISWTVTVTWKPATSIEARTVRPKPGVRGWISAGCKPEVVYRNLDWDRDLFGWTSDIE